SVFSIPASIRHLQVPQIPPPHLNGIPPFSRIEIRRRLLFSGALTTRLSFLRKVISTIVYVLVSAVSAVVLDVWDLRNTRSALMLPKVARLSSSARASSSESNLSRNLVRTVLAT